MIALDLTHTLLFNIGVNTFSCIITLIIFYSYKKNFADTYDIWLLCKIEVLILLILLADIGMWLLNGKSGQLMRTLNYADNILYFLMQIAVAFYWLRYAYYQTFKQNFARKKEIFWVIIPFILLSIIVITSPFNGWCFYLDDANYYHRGVLSAPMSIVILAYLLSVSVIAFTQYKKEVFSDRKKELLTIAFFVVAPFNESRQFPFQLSVSAGYAISSKKGVNRTANLFKEADENMYHDKTLYHRKEQK